MDRRAGSLIGIEDVIRIAIETRLQTVWTALPAIIDSFDPVNMTVTAQPAIAISLQGSAGGAPQNVNLPLLADIPVVFPGGGGFNLTFPIKEGDECLLVFSARCIDNWWVSGEVQPQAQFRKQNLSDGFAFVGVKSLPRTFDGEGFRPVDLTKAELRSLDGETSIGITEEGEISIETPKALTINVVGDTVITSSGQATISAPTVEITGGELITAGQAAPDSAGPYCAVDVCPFNGVPHRGSTVNGT